MPQMAPYNWLNLSIMFNMILIIMISYIYYVNWNKNINLLNQTFLKKKYLFKW